MSSPWCSPTTPTERAIVGWHDWLLTADRATWGMVNITVGAGSDGCTIVLATPAGDGPSGASALSVPVGVEPESSSRDTLARMDFVHYFEGGSQAAQPRSFVAGSDIIGEMTPAAAQSIVAATTAWRGDGGSATAVIGSLSGAVNDMPRSTPRFRGGVRPRAFSGTPSEFPPPDVETATEWVAARTRGCTRTRWGLPQLCRGEYARVAGFRRQRGAPGRLARQKYDPAGLMYREM